MRRGLWFAATAVLAAAGCATEANAPVEPALAVEPITATLPASANAEPQPQPSAPALLSPVAFREGRIELAAWADQPFALIDGEPIPLLAGQPVRRDARLALGLAADKASFASTHELVAFGGSLADDPSAHLVFAEHFERANTEYFSYARTRERWQPIAMPSRDTDPRIEIHYGAFVETGGALLGLRRPVIRSGLWDWGDADDPSMDRRLKKIGVELGKLPRGFEVLAGSLAHKPALPNGWDASDAISLADGTIVALGYRHRTSLDGEHGPARVLSWAPGQIEATSSELPNLVDPSIHALSLSATDTEVFIAGLRELPNADDRPYLARRELDGSWTEVALELPGVNERVSSATITPSGELWIVTGGWNYASEQPCSCLWRKPVDGGWQAVELEPVSLFRDDEPRWAHVLSEQNWIEVPAGSSPRLLPAARRVAWAGGALWVTAELGPSYPTARDRVLADPRTVLFASVPVATASELIATDRLFDERVDRRVAQANPTPGSDGCRTFHMVITDDPDGDGRDAYVELLGRIEQLDAVATIERDDGWGSASMIYVGELDGRAQLVVEANGWNPLSAIALADGFAQVLGRPLALDCRPRAMVRPVQRFFD